MYQEIIKTNETKSYWALLQLVLKKPHFTFGHLFRATGNVLQHGSCEHNRKLITDTLIKG